MPRPHRLRKSEKWGVLYGCEAFVLPSHQENFGIAVVEALACGKPVLISDQVNIWREIVEDGAGFVDSDTEQGVESLLRRFLFRCRLSGGNEEKAKIERLSRSCYQKRFGIRSASNRLAEALKPNPSNTSRKTTTC
jgi:glycosyltransferase involved in cell wall biosynthesis